MSFFVYGINHKICPVEIREKFFYGENHLREALIESKKIEGLNELVILSTCNRVEFFGHCDKGQNPQVLIQGLIYKTLNLSHRDYAEYAQFQESKDAVLYIFRVAAGLESLVIGENEILGQLREAFRVANESSTIHSLLYRLMEKSLKVGKDVRADTKINQGAVGIASVAVELAEKIFGKLTDEKVMVLGLGEMGQLTLKNLSNSGAEILYVASRQQEKGEKIAIEFGAQWLSEAAWQEKLGEVDILITSTSSAEPILWREDVVAVMAKRKHRPLFMIDIAVPRDIDQRVNEIDDVYLYNVDDLKSVADMNLRSRRKEIHHAEALVQASVLSFSSWLEQLDARPTIVRFENFVDSILDDELKKITKDSDELSQIKKRIRSKMLYSPIERIKEASQNGGVNRYLEALHSLFKLDQENKEEK